MSKSTFSILTFIFNVFIFFRCIIITFLIVIFLYIYARATIFIYFRNFVNVRYAFFIIRNGTYFFIFVTDFILLFSFIVFYCNYITIDRHSWFQVKYYSFFYSVRLLKLLFGHVFTLSIISLVIYNSVH